MSLQPQVPSRHRRALPKGQREPSTNQAQATQRRDRPEEFEPRRVQDEGVDAPAEHGHAGREEAGSDRVVTGDEQGDGVGKLG